MNLAVIGLGKLGLPLASLHAESSRVFGIDQNTKLVREINAGECPIQEPGLELLLSRVVRNKTLTAHTDYTVVRACEASLIIVPTPSKPDGSFELKYVEDACRKIGYAIRERDEHHTVIVCSTVMPGACSTEIKDALEATSGKAVGGDELGLVYSPEFIALGSVLTDMQYPDMILIGESDTKAGQVYEAVARRIANAAPVMPKAFHMSLTSAEIAKISVNSFVTMKISFANALTELCEKYDGADTNAVTKAIGKDRRIGDAYLKPGVAFGGPCFPRDNRAMRFAGKAVGVELPFTTATDKINSRQVRSMVERIHLYNREQVGILGLAYKPGTAVTEESFGVQLAWALYDAGYDVSVFDPLVKEQPDLLPDKTHWRVLPSEVISNEILTVICTPDPKFAPLFPITFAVPTKQLSLVMDCWNMIEPGPWDDINVIKLGRP